MRNEIKFQGEPRTPDARHPGPGEADRQRAPRALAGTIFLLLLVCGVCRADLLHLHDGRVLEGEVTEAAGTVRIRMNSGVTLSFTREQVRRIEKRASATGSYARRVAAIAPDDAKGLLELARWCVQSKLKVEAERAYQAVLQVASPHYVPAKFELAKLLEERGQLRAAVGHYDELVSRAKHSESRLRAYSLKRTLDRKRANDFDAGEKALRLRRPYEALQFLVAAYHKTYPVIGKPRVGAVTEEQILHKLVDVRAHIDESLAKRAGTATPMRGCGTCSQKGWGRCWKCGGRGTITITRTVIVRGRAQRQRVQARCPTCKGRREAPCKTCTGTHVDLKGLPSDLRGDLLSTAKDAFSGTGVSGSLERALGLIQRRVISSKLAVPRGDAPPFAMSTTLSSSLGAAPFTPAKGISRASPKLAAAWRTAKPEVRANFLVDYARRFSAYLSPYFGLTAGPGRKITIKPVQASLSLKELRAVALPVTATRAAALIEDYNGQWLALSGVLNRPLVKSTLPGARALTLQTEAPHNLSTFTWATGAKQEHGTILGHVTVPALKGLPEHFPYRAVNAALDKMQRDQAAIIYGRLIYAKGSPPQARFEVWAVEPRLDLETERLLARVKKPISFRFEGTPLNEAAGLLRLLSNFPIELEVPDAEDIKLSARVQRLPLGQALTTMLAGADLKWAFTETGLKISGKVSGAERSQVRRVMQFLDEK